MAKHYDEGELVRLVSKVCKVDTVTKTIKANKEAVVGINMHGKIDGLCNYYSYTFIWDNSVNKGKIITDNEESDNRKKSKKEHPLTNKRK